MNSKYRSDSHIELYVDAEELHFLAHAATDLLRRPKHAFYFTSSPQARFRLCTNHLQNLSMRLRAMAAQSDDPQTKLAAMDKEAWKGTAKILRAEQRKRGRQP
jgi:hypothetical protein